MATLLESQSASFVISAKWFESGMIQSGKHRCENQNIDDSEFINVAMNRSLFRDVGMSQARFDDVWSVYEECDFQVRRTW